MNLCQLHLPVKASKVQNGYKNRKKGKKKATNAIGSGV
jgi:hypothetical protein